MKIIIVIEDEQVIEKILKHLGLWDQKARPPPKANATPMAPEYHIDYTDSQIPGHCLGPGFLFPPTLNFSPQATPTTS